MSSNKRIRVDNELSDISEQFELCLPDVQISYGSFVYDEVDLIEEEEDIYDKEDNERQTNEEESNLYVEYGQDFMIDDEEEDVYDNDVSQNITTFEDVNFDDSQLFAGAKVVHKDYEDVTTDTIVEDELYPGSHFNVKLFCRFLLILKTTHSMGDVAFASIAGAIISFLPSDNKLSTFVGENPSIYILLNSIQKLSKMNNCCRIFKFNSCDMGKCILNQPHNQCFHSKLKRNNFHYLPIRDRIISLLKSDVKNLFLYYKYMSTFIGDNVSIECIMNEF